MTIECTVQTIDKQARTESMAKTKRSPAGLTALVCFCAQREGDAIEQIVCFLSPSRPRSATLKAQRSS